MPGRNGRAEHPPNGRSSRSSANGRSSRPGWAAGWGGGYRGYSAGRGWAVSGADPGPFTPTCGCSIAPTSSSRAEPGQSQRGRTFDRRACGRLRAVQVAGVGGGGPSRPTTSEAVRGDGVVRVPPVPSCGCGPGHAQAGCAGALRCPLCPSAAEPGVSPCSALALTVAAGVQAVCRSAAAR